MTRADFFAVLHTAAPGSTPEAVQRWIDFAANCVSEGQYANFTPSMDAEADVEKWLDTLCGGLYAVRAEYGGELAGKLVELSLDNCCLYPGEMLQAAACLRDGGTAETISGKIASDEIESEQPFFPVPIHPLTERDCGPDLLIREREVLCGLAEQRMEPGYILWNGTVLLESARDNSGCYKAVGLDGMFRQAAELYRPSYTDDGRLWAFRQVRSAPENYLATTEMSVENNCNQIDGIINNTAPKPDELASEDEALFLVGGTTYLHIQTSEDDRDYTHEDCYATYDYALYDKNTMRQLDGGRMEVAADIRDAPEQVHRLAAQNILECRTVLGASPLELVSLDILEALQDAAMREIEEGTAPKPSLRDNLKQCQREAADRSQGGGSPGRHSPGKER